MFQRIEDLLRQYKTRLEVINLEVLLFRHKVKDDSKVFDEWTLPATDRFPAREMVGINFYDLDNERMDRINVALQDWAKVQIVDSQGNEHSIEDIDMLVSKPQDSMLIVCRFETEEVRKGMVSIQTLKRIKFVSQLTIEMP